HAERPVGIVLSAAVPVRRPSVLAWREALLGLAERLEAPVPLDPCGVARALVLLTDEDGPFYDAGADRSMGDAVWWTAGGLQRCLRPSQHLYDGVPFLHGLLIPHEPGSVHGRSSHIARSRDVRGAVRPDLGDRRDMTLVVASISEADLFSLIAS